MANGSPLKGVDLFEGVAIPMTIGHFMPLNQKFVPLLKAGTVIDKSRSEKALKVEEVYFKRDDIWLFHEYCKNSADVSAEGLLSRCRNHSLSMSIVYKNLVFL